MSKPKDLVPVESGELATPQSPTVDVQGLIKLAVESGNREVMQELMAMRREVRAEQAKDAYYTSMREFQKACPNIEKVKWGAKRAYKYAPLDWIVGQLKDLIAQHGFSFSVTSKIIAVPGDEKRCMVEATCRVNHASGHREESVFSTEADNTNRMMSLPQKYAAAETFAKRYAFLNAFGIVTADEDTDAQAPVPQQGPSSIGGERKVDAAMKRRLVDLTREIHMVSSGYNLDGQALGVLQQWLWDEAVLDPDETLQQIKGQDLVQAVAKVEEKLNVH